MYKRKEPLRLEDQAREKVNSMIRNVCQNWTNELVIAAEDSPDDYLRETKFVKVQSEKLRLVISELAVPSVVELVVNSAIKNFSSLIDTYHERRRTSIHTRGEMTLHYRICSTMLKAVMLPCVCQLKYDIETFTESPFVQELLLGVLYLVPNIMFVGLPTLGTTRYYVSNYIPMLTKLREFHYPFECTNKIVLKIVKNCPQIHTIFAQYSRLTDFCLYELLKCDSLRIINVSRTNISEKAYATLLANMQIKSIEWNTPIERVLDYVTELPHVKIFIGTFSNPIPLTQKCPNIIHLTLLGVTVKVSKSQDLRYVESLKLCENSFITTDFGTLLDNLGKKLIVLQFHAVRSVDLDIVVKCCTSLRSLEFSCCWFTFSNDVNFNAESEHFKSVTDLKVIGIFDRYDFTSKLHLYINLENFHAESVGLLNDDSIQNVINYGGLRNIKKFTVMNCDIGMQTAQNLTENSRELTQLGNIERWRGLTVENVIQLKNFISVHNLSLELI